MINSFADRWHWLDYSSEFLFTLMLISYRQQIWKALVSLIRHKYGLFSLNHFSSISLSGENANEPMSIVDDNWGNPQLHNVLGPSESHSTLFPESPGCPACFFSCKSRGVSVLGDQHGVPRRYPGRVLYMMSRDKVSSFISLIRGKWDLNCI